MDRIARSLSAPGGALPRSLLGSLAVHSALIGAGVLWGVLAPGGEPRVSRAFATQLAGPPLPASEEPREVLEWETEVELAEPELRESVLWAEPDTALEAPARPAEPGPLRAVDWIAERPFHIGTLGPSDPPAECGEAAPAVAAAVLAAPARAEPLVLEPVPRAMPAPGYPRLSRRNGEEGSVLCRLRLDAAGSVVAVEVLESSGYPRLDEAARRALAGWRFEPRREDGRAVPGSVLHRVTFRLSG